MLGAGPLRLTREVTLPQLAPALVGRGGADVPLLLHVVRRHPDPRRARAGDGRDRDLQPGGAAVRPPGRSGAVAAAARRGRARARRREHPRGARGRRRHARRRARRAAPAGGRERVALAVVLAAGRARARAAARRARRSARSGSWGALFDETPALLVEPWQAAVYSVAFASVAALLALVVGGLAAVALARRPPGRRSTGSSCSRSAPRP